MYSKNKKKISETVPAITLLSLLASISLSSTDSGSGGGNSSNGGGSKCPLEHFKSTLINENNSQSNQNN